MTENQIFLIHLQCLLSEIVRRGKYDDWKNNKYHPSEDKTFPKIFLESNQTVDTATNVWKFHLQRENELPLKNCVPNKNE